MSRRNVPRPTIPSKPLNPAQGRVSAEQQQKKKKQKTSYDLSAPSVSKAIQVVDSASDPREKELLANPHVDLTDPQVEAAVLRPFSPSYTMPDGRILMLKDSVKEEPNLAVTLLRGLALPRDCDQVPSDLIPNFAEMCSHLVQADQAALKAYDKAEKVQAERERFRSDRETYKAKWRSSQKELKEEEAEVERLKKELAESRAATASAEAMVEKLKEEEKDKLRQADLKGYGAGIERAAMEYTRTAYKMVNEALEGRLPDFYKRGYAEGAHQMAGVMAIQANPGFLRQLAEPVVPDLELPYTEEDCAPLPPEEDDDAEMAEASEKMDAAEAEDGEKAAETEGQQEVAAVENP